MVNQTLLTGEVSELRNEFVSTKSESIDICLGLGDLILSIVSKFGYNFLILGDKMLEELGNSIRPRAVNRNILRHRTRSHRVRYINIFPYLALTNKRVRKVYVARKPAKSPMTK